MRAGRGPAHRWELQAGLQTPRRCWQRSWDWLQEGVLCENLPNPQFSGGGRREKGEAAAYPQSQTHSKVGWQVKDLCYLPETPAELMVDSVIFVDCILQYNPVPVGLKEMWA